MRCGEGRSHLFSSRLTPGNALGQRLMPRNRDIGLEDQPPLFHMNERALPAIQEDALTVCAARSAGATSCSPREASERSSSVARSPRITLT